MLIPLINGQISIPVAVLIVIAIIMALTFRQFGYALTANLFGDDTGKRAGHLTTNPLVHIDPMGLLFIVLIGFGFAKPVPTDARNFSKPYAMPVVALSASAVNFLLAVLAVNVWGYGLVSGIDVFIGQGQSTFFYYFVYINLLIFLFNMLPVGSLDGHHILEFILPSPLDQKYSAFNEKYGNFLLLGFVVVSILGFPAFAMLANFAQQIIPAIQFIK